MPRRAAPDYWLDKTVSAARLPYRPYLEQEGFLDRRNAGPADGEFIQVGNPENRGLRRQWEIRYGRDWPRDPVTGRLYDVAHIRALADGGTNTVDNIRPLHPNEHRAEHHLNNDHSRWAKRSWIARAFGGTVMKGIGGLPLISGALGVLSGRLRTDTFDNFSSDMLGIPSASDERKKIEEEQRRYNPHWKWGDPMEA